MSQPQWPGPGEPLPPSGPPPGWGAPPPQWGPPQAPPGYNGMAWVPAVGWVRLATTGQRVGARIIDALIVLLVLGALVTIVGIPFFLAAGASSSTSPDSGVAAFFGVTTFVLFIVALLAAIAVGVLYEVGFVVWKGGTPGKLLLHLRIVDEQSGRYLGWGPSFLRWLIPTAANAVCGILELVVYMSFLWDGQHRMQGWHDKVAKDFVIHTG